MGSGKFILIGTTGLPLSGKGEFSNVAEIMGFRKLIMGDVIRKAISEKGLEINRKNSNKVMIELRKEKGKVIVANTVLDWVQDELQRGQTKILIDGIRSIEEVATLRNSYRNMKIVAIHANPTTRYQRSQHRKRMDDAINFDSFNERDEIELNVGIGNVIALSDIFVESNKNLDQMKVIYRAVLNEILKNEGELDVMQNV